MLDLQQHKEFLWKYKLIYENVKPKKENSMAFAFPFLNLSMDKPEDLESMATDSIKEQLFACETLEDIFDFISLEYQDYYFMEISALLHEPGDQPLYSTLLRKTFDHVGVTDYISTNNYEHLIQFADEDTKTYIANQLKK